MKFQFEKAISDELQDYCSDGKMPKYEIYIKRKDYEFRFEDENLKTFKEGLAGFLSLVEEFDKPVAESTGKADKRRGGRRPPFVKNAIMDLIQKEPQWFVRKFPEQVKDKISTEYGSVGAKTASVNVALVRFFGKGILTREEIEGKYAYSVPSISTKSTGGFTATGGEDRS